MKSKTIDDENATSADSRLVAKKRISDESMSGPRKAEHGTVTDVKPSRDETLGHEPDTSVKTAGSMQKETLFLTPRYDSPKLLMRSRDQIQKKLLELEDQYFYLQKLSKTPFSADELKLKAEALRWVLCKQQSL